MAGTNSSQLRAETAGGAGEASQHLAQWFVSELSTIDAATAAIARGHRLTADQADDLRALVHLKLIDNDYAILRKFEGRGSFRAYVSVIARRVLLDMRAGMWGKWRPSAQAKREGEVARLLERLTTRQGLPFDQACRVLETKHGVALDRATLQSMYDRLPPRAPRLIVGAEPLEKLPAASASAEDLAEAGERRCVARRAAQILAAELTRLSADDRRILQLRFVDGLTIAEIGSRLSCANIKALYRRVRTMLDELRARLEAHGLDRAEVLDVVGRDDVTVPRVLALPPGSRPRVATVSTSDVLRRRSG